MAAAPVRQPPVTSALPPSRAASRPAYMPVMNMVIAEGSSMSPERVMLAPKPYPAADGVWTNSGRNANVAYIPTPSSSETRLFVHTAVRRIIFMSISGVAARSSAVTQPAASSTAAASRPRTRLEPQPQAGASLSATSSATSHADSSRAGAQLIRPGVRTGDSGTKSTADTAAMIVRTIGSQNSQW